MRYHHALILALLMGCTLPETDGTAPALQETPIETATPPPPPAMATTVEEFDTTTAADRAAAVVVQASAAEMRLGTTIATLGPPTEPGIWLKTPLVRDVRAGRIVYQGKSVNLELRPSGGAPGSGSQISLAAMRLIGAALTGLPEIEVFAM